jgi:sulfoxide reductase heme-binding subunit YedZ
MKSLLFRLQTGVWLKPVTLLLGLLPFFNLIFRSMLGALGSDPVETLTRQTGIWALNLLWIVLGLTPLRRLTGWNSFQRVRRMLGLLAFFYAGLHLLIYLVFDQFFDVEEIVNDVLKRPYITAGFSAFVMLTPLAWTSRDRLMRRMGRNWKSLHQLVYPAALLGVLHYSWLVKKDLRDPLIYAGILSLLFLLRIRWRRA